LAWIFSFLLLFSIAHTFLWHMKTFERDTHVIWMEYFYLVDKKTCFCVTLSIGVSILYVGVCESWSWVYDENLNKGHNNLTKLNVITSSIWLRFCMMECCHMALVGIIIIWGACYLSFFSLKYAGELRIIALRRRVVKYNMHTTHTPLNFQLHSRMSK
jgi:hypothetical protein